MSNKNEENILLKLIIESLEKLDETVQKIDKRIDHIDVTMAKNTVSLEEHVKRTNLLEEQIKPVRSFYDGMIFTGKIIGFLTLLASFTLGVLELLKYMVK